MYQITNQPQEAEYVFTTYLKIRVIIYTQLLSGLSRWDDILIYKSQQDAHITEFILSDNCSTCFGRHHQPSSGAQATVTTASGNRYTVIDRVKFAGKEYR